MRRVFSASALSSARTVPPAAQRLAGARLDALDELGIVDLELDDTVKMATLRLQQIVQGVGLGERAGESRQE